MDLHVAASFLLVGVDADHDALALLHVPCEAKRRLLDLVLDEALLDGHGERRGSSMRSISSQAVSRGSRVSASTAYRRPAGLLSRRRAHLVLKHLLRAQRDACGRSVGSASASSNSLCNDCAPPRTAASAWITLRCSAPAAGP